MTCVYYNKITIQENLTNQQLQKLVSIRLICTVAINILAIKLLGGVSIKQAALIGAASSLASDLLHIISHQISDKLCEPIAISCGSIIGIACSYFSNIPIVSYKTLAYTASPLIAYIPAVIYLLSKDS